MPIEHYENFPVASLLLPAPLRPPVRALYRFARWADDLADEGDAPDGERLAALAGLRRVLDAIEAGAPAGSTGGWDDLAGAVRVHRLPLQPLRDLLSAFEQDITVKRYRDRAQLLDYCRRSAQTIGRLMLALLQPSGPAAAPRARLEAWSDAICSGLQLVNFWQDVALDWAKGRVYLPQDELRRHGVEESAIAQGRTGGGWRALMAAQVAHARELLQAGAPLATTALPGRLGWELRLVVQGGLLIAQRIDEAGGDVFRHRPQLTRLDWLRLGARAARMGGAPPAVATAAHGAGPQAR